MNKQVWKIIDPDKLPDIDVNSGPRAQQPDDVDIDELLKIRPPLRPPSHLLPRTEKGIRLDGGVHPFGLWKEFLRIFYHGKPKTRTLQTNHGSVIGLSKLRVPRSIRIPFHKYVIVVTSYMLYSSVNCHEWKLRLDQTLQTLLSIRENIPNVYIIYVEGCEKFNEQSWFDHLIPHFDLCIQQDIPELDGIMQWKSWGDYILTYIPCQSINTNDFEGFFKISARYRLNNEHTDNDYLSPFNISNYNAKPMAMWYNQFGSLITVFYYCPRGYFGSLVKRLRELVPKCLDIGDPIEQAMFDTFERYEWYDTMEIGKFGVIGNITNASGVVFIM